jgi:LysM repeat protein
MQPWGGRLLRYNLGGGRDQQLGVEIDRPVAGPAPVGGPVAKPGRPAAPKPAPPTKPAPRVYVVKRGDTLAAIAAAQHVTLQALMRANPQIKNPNLILVGQRITVPT